MVKMKLLGFFSINLPTFIAEKAIIKPVKVETIFEFNTMVSTNKGKIGLIIWIENCTKNSIKNMMNNCPLLKNKATLFLNGMICFFVTEGVKFSSTKKKTNHPAIKSKAAVIRKEFRKPKISAEIPPNKGPKKLPKKNPVCNNPKLNPIFLE